MMERPKPLYRPRRLYLPEVFHAAGVAGGGGLCHQALAREVDKVHMSSTGGGGDCGHGGL
jgi:hypothetical protein